MFSNCSTRVEAAQRGQCNLRLLSVDRGLLADRAGGDGAVLFANRGRHVAGRQAARSQLMRIEPDTHAVIALAEQKDVADAVDARQLVLHLQDGVIAEEELVKAAFGGQQGDAAQNVGRALDRRHARLLDHVGQRGDRQAHPVLHEHLRHVEVDAVLERDHQVVRAVVGALRVHVHHALDAVDLLLDGSGNGFGHVLGARARIGAGDLHRRRRHRRELRQTEIEDGDAPRQRNHDRQHRGEDRPIDEEPRDHPCSSWSVFGVKERPIDRWRPISR